jgi:hypothetical protein
MRAPLACGFSLLAAGLLSNCSGPVTSPALLSGAAPSAHSRPGAIRPAVTYRFKTVTYPGLSNFNELLGINNQRHLVGYFGSGTPSDPSSGYVVYPPYLAEDFRLLQYPQATNTIATAPSNIRTIAGYYTTGGRTLSFLFATGIWYSYEDPHASGPSGKTEILSLNDSGIAVGIYQASSSEGAFEVNIATGHFQGITPPKGTDMVPTGINGHGDLVGYWTQSGTTVGFLRKNGTYTEFTYPGSKSTRFLGVTAHDYIVGSYVDKSGNTHGFLLISPLWKPGTKWQSLDDPNAAGTTVATGVNIHQDVVGYYIDHSGTTHGFLATPSSSK